jgi:hypothetical protein
VRFAPLLLLACCAQRRPATGTDVWNYGNEQQDCVSAAATRRAADACRWKSYDDLCAQLEAPCTVPPPTAERPR